MRPSRSVRFFLFSVLLTVGFDAAFAIAEPAGGNEGNPDVIPPGAKFHGLSFGQWQARWWQWAFSLPATDHPFNPGGNVLQGQTDHVWFLAGVFGTEERSITIPVGTALFFPIANSECSTAEPPPFHGGNEAELRACAKENADTISDLAAEIDGVSVQNIPAYRHQSPVFTFGPLPDDNILGLPAGTTAQSVDDGIYLLLAPLSVGTHTIRFTATFEGIGAIDRHTRSPSSLGARANVATPAAPRGGAARC